MSFTWGNVVLEPVLSDTVSSCVFSCLFAFNLSILTVRVVSVMLVVAGMSLRHLETPQVTEVLFFLKTYFFSSLFFLLLFFRFTDFFPALSTFFSLLIFLSSYFSFQIFHLSLVVSFCSFLCPFSHSICIFLYIL